ncbi:MAG: CheR family methyltransferase [Chloroflexia bacterium]
MSETANGVTSLVVVGSSAGGKEALSTLVSTLPKGFRPPIMIAQHLDPTRESHLADILSRRTEAPVRTVAEHEPLQPSTIYVVPANRHVNISDHAIDLQTDGSSRPRPSVDLLLATASEVFGERLFAVILSGSGSDGSVGARAVKQAGGTVVVQNPLTAGYPGMPQSLTPSTIDIIADVENIGQILHDLSTGLDAPTTGDEQREIALFLDDLRQKHGIDFRSYKAPTIRRWLQRRFVATNSQGLEGYRSYLREQPDEHQILVGSFLIKVTEFFRDAETFAYIQNDILPKLIARAQDRGSELRIWSAGCATGEEAYSLAIAVSEAIGDNFAAEKVRIFATDLDANAIAFARRGAYSELSLDEMPQELINKYFVRTDDGYQVSKRIRSLVVFGRHDLGQKAPFPQIDLVVCRNVLIYFTTELLRRTLQTFAFSLRDEGYLVLGKAETVSPLPDFFTTDNKQLRVFRRQGDRFLMPPVQPYAYDRPNPTRVGADPIRRAHSVADTSAIHRDGRSSTSDGAGYLLRLPIGVLVVNRQYDIQTINTAARRLLKIPGVAVGEDLLHLARDLPYEAVRAAIDAAIRERRSVVVEEFAVPDLVDDLDRYLQLECCHFSDDGDPALEGALVTIRDTTTEARHRLDLETRLSDVSEELEATRRQTADEKAQHEQVVWRIMERNEQLLVANQAMTIANEELHTANDDFLIIAEEAQAATEEVETLNEELQATNEELETLNEEFQATIEELNTTNDDLHARSQELQELAAVAEQGKRWLEVVLSRLSDGVLIVDRQAKSLLANDAYLQMFGGTPDNPISFQACDENGRALSEDQTPQRRAAQGEAFEVLFSVTRDDHARGWYEARARPMVNSSGALDASVIVVRDVTENSVHKLHDDVLAVTSHELQTPITSITAYLQLLNRAFKDQSPDEKPRVYSERALQQIRQMSRIVNDLLDVSRIRTGKLSLVFKHAELEPIVAHAMDVAQTYSDSHVLEYSANAEDACNVDAERIQQVLSNLIRNALIHTPRGGSVKVTLDRNDKYAQIVVRDQGDGIASADLPYIFSRFYQGRQLRPHADDGLGLGLYMCHQIIVAHGGTIAVESVEGDGAAFTIRLPLHSKTDEESDED